MSEREKKLQKIVELESSLDVIQDVDVLLERILTEARGIVNADAGSIYIVEGNKLKIKYAQNDTQLKRLPPGEKLPYLFFSFPIDKTSIAGYVACTKEPLVIDDAYKIAPEKPYKFNSQTDFATNYRTQSMYTFPLVMNNGVLLGVLQIINKFGMGKTVKKFTKEDDTYFKHFALFAVRALQHAYITRENHRKMLKMSEFRDPKETFLHTERVSSIALEIYDRWAYEKNIPQDEQNAYRDNLKIAAKFHDIGKVGISDLILKKPGKFTADERQIMKGHTCIGAQLFEPAENELDIMCRDVALCHHEHYDGGEGGYPGKDYYNGKFKDFLIGSPVELSAPLKGSEIPLAARIVAVADVFDALSHKRCYKEAWSLEDAYNEIQKGSGTQFDPEMVNAFLKVRERVEKILIDYHDLEE